VDERRLSDVLGSDANGWELQVKDLGPQVNWKTVFFVEYVSVFIPFSLEKSDAFREDWANSYPSTFLSFPTVLVRGRCPT